MAVPDTSADGNQSDVAEPLVDQANPDAARMAPGRRVERVCLVVLTTLAVFYTLYFARAILLPATLALLLNLLFKPVTRRLARFGIPATVSAAMIFVLATVVIVVGVSLLVDPAAKWLSEAPRQFRAMEEDIQAIAKPFRQIVQAKEEVDAALPGQDSAVPVRIKQPPLANDMISSTGGFFTGAVVTLALLFFLLAAGDRFLEKTVEMVPTWRAKRDIVMIFREIQQRISAYLGAITLINIGLGVVIGAGLWAIGMPNPLLWGVLAAVLNYIPFAGLFAGTAIVFVAAIAEFTTLGHALLAPAIYLGANGVEANFVTPAVLGQSISLNPVVILLAIIVAGWTWGIGGIFLAVPVLLVVKIACEHNETLKPISVFLEH